MHRAVDQEGHDDDDAVFHRVEGQDGQQGIAPTDVFDRGDGLGHGIEDNQ